MDNIPINEHLQRIYKKLFEAYGPQHWWPGNGPFEMMAGAILTTSGIHYLSGSLSFARLTYTYLPYGLILMLPEAFINGMLMTVFVAYRPEWVSTFDDQRYLKNH